MARLRFPVRARIPVLAEMRDETVPLPSLPTIDYDVPQRIFDLYMTGQIDRQSIEMNFNPVAGPSLPTAQLRDIRAAFRHERHKENQELANHVVETLLSTYGHDIEREGFGDGFDEEDFGA